MEFTPLSSSAPAMGHAAPRAQLRRVIIAGILAVAPLLAVPVDAHMHGMFATKAEAEKRAAQLQCKGSFAMGELWMPCANERALHDALQKQK